MPILRRLEAKVYGDGLYAAGFMSYEAAPAFDSALEVRPLEEFPLLWFGLYDRPRISEHPPATHHTCSVGDWVPSIDRVSYFRAIARIKTLIAQGETYQVNFTMRLKAPFHGEPLALFQQLVQAQRADYAAFVRTNRFCICSASPELFFHLDSRQLSSRPMKGTAARGRWVDEDMAQAEWLHNSVKNRAENVMIVDMVRNDMGRIAEVGSVKVPRLFHVEQYPTVWQMTSTVTADTTVDLSQIMAALFPCASITGAPKPRTMHIISNLEATPRKVYTGCIGFLTPQRRAQFNVAIRTVIVDKEKGYAEYGVGGGIVWDSESRDEYEECRIKAKVLTEKRPRFSLLETILWEPETGFFLLDGHMQRMGQSARYFGFPFDMEGVLLKLTHLKDTFSTTPLKIRMLLDSAGGVTCQSSPLPSIASPAFVRLGMASSPVDSSNIFLYHKTTYRDHYVQAQKGRPECDDVLLWNERGEITESCIANVVALLDGEWITPPVACGLLPGTYRAWLLDQKRIRERIITLDMLERAEEVCLANSVRKWRKAVLVEDRFLSASHGKSR